MSQKIIDRIDSPKDLKHLTMEELNQLAGEIRELLLYKVSQTGGHVGPNLAAVEFTIALHYVFNSPKDKFVWDVSHQSYPHKILTGRKQAWQDPTHFKDVTGYTEPEESEHDFFTIGHTSTSVSLAVGLAKARDIKDKQENIVAVIGDGSLSGGLAFEGLSNAAELGSNFIILVNDNEMSIDENHGGIYRNLRALREGKGEATTNLFTAIGLDYRYIENGNDVATLIEAFKAVKDIDHPIVLHVHTEKGHGYKPAVENKMAFHWSMPFDIETGKVKMSGASTESYESVILDVLNETIAKNEQDIVAINAAIPGAFQLKRFQAIHPDRYFDVGIAEQHSLTFAAGLAKAGVKPIVFHSSTFLQRGYDQLSHDLGINSLPAVIMIKGGTISGGDPTHQGNFDIPMITSIPNIAYLAPTTKEELIAMLQYALSETKRPVAIRIPSQPMVSKEADKNFAPYAYQTVVAGTRVALLAVGGFQTMAQEVHAQLAEQGIQATIVNPRVVSELDEDYLNALATNHDLIVTMEDGSLEGGFGEKVSRFYGTSNVKVLNIGAQKRFNHFETLDQLYTEFHLKPELIVEDILNLL